jgi:tetratricopeptide (TPR) repeat protein
MTIISDHLKRFAFSFLFVLVMTAGLRAASSGLDEYYRLRTTDPVVARRSLETTVAQEPSNVAAQMEMAYLLTNEKKYDQAVECLKAALKTDPGNEKAKLQLAYTYQSMGKAALARKTFDELKDFSGTPNTSACQALSDLAPQRWQFLPRPYFADIYFAPLYLSRFNDYIAYSQTRAGVALSKRGEWEIYGSLRYNDDSKSTGGTAPAIWSDNAAIFAAGVRYRPFRKIPVSAYAEQGRAYDLLDQNRDRWRDDFRSGLSYFDRWTAPANCAPELRFPFTRSSSLYADVSYYSRYDYNWIGYLQWREGRRLVEKSRMTLDGFLYLGGSADSNRDYYNNVIDVGAGATFTPDHSYPFYFRYTAVRGSYLDVASTIPNPNKKTYTDQRWELVGYVRF